MNGSKILYALAILLVLVASTLRFADKLAFAQSPDDYTYSHTKRNMYQDEVLILNFSALTPTQVYSISAQRLDLLGNVLDIIETDFFTNLTSTQLIWNTGNSDLPLGTYPFRIIDNFGNVLSYHFMAPAPLRLDWNADTTNTLANHKQGMIAAPYIVENVDGWHRVMDEAFSMTAYGNITLFHYTATSTASTDEFRFRDLDTLVTTKIFSVAEFIDYNEDSAFADPNAAKAYVVFNTDGHELEFIDKEASQAAFISGNDNPHTLTIPQGVYDYPRFMSSGSYLSFGQSVWIVSEAPIGGQEYQFTREKQSLPQSDTQVLNFLQFSPSVHTDYPLQRLTDSNLGTVDDTDYEYVKNRVYTFVVSNTLGTATLTWIWQAVGMSVPSIDPFQFRFQETQTYVITALATLNDTPEEHIGGFLNLLALNSPLGHLIAMLSSMLLAFYGISKLKMLPQTGKLTLQSLAYVAVGLMFILSGYSTTLVEIIWGAGAFFIFIMLMRKATGQHA